MERSDCEGTSGPPTLCFPPHSHPTAKTEAWCGCQEAEGAAAWGAGSQGSLGWHVTRSTGFLDSLPACFPLKLSMESTCSCEMFQFCKISIFQQRSIPLENFQPALIIRASLSSHTGALLKDIKFLSCEPKALLACIPHHSHGHHQSFCHSRLGVVPRVSPHDSTFSFHCETLTGTVQQQAPSV